MEGGLACRGVSPTLGFSPGGELESAVSRGAPWIPARNPRAAGFHRSCKMAVTD